MTFQDLCAGRGPDVVGYSKIQRCCAQAWSDGWQYVWIDSCCIDKSSSAELSEAINSMLKWYRDAQVCYAYLSDVPTLERKEEHFARNSALRLSEWFNRGWTLQELLAPEFLVFFDQNWKEIDTKSRLRGLLSEITGITHLTNYKSASVAQKFSWASRPRTTRLEDQAYCLMGIFGVNMPLLYGEGRNAFMRLQQEIVKISNDESIFAWTSRDIELYAGLLAPSPAAFENSKDITANGFDFQYPYLRTRSVYAMTNKGLEIELLLNYKGYRDFAGESRLEFFTPLRCRRDYGKGEIITLCVQETGEGTGNFVRHDADQLEVADDSTIARGTLKQRVVYFQQPNDKDAAFLRINKVQVQLDPQYRSKFSVYQEVVSPQDNAFWIGEYESGYLLFFLNRKPTQARLYLKTTDFVETRQDIFCIVISLWDDSSGSDIGLSILSTDTDLAQPQCAWDQTPQPSFFKDRVSKRLDSGWSVSAILRRKVDAFKTRIYSVEVGIDSDGSLPWPESWEALWDQTADHIKGSVNSENLKKLPNPDWHIASLYT